MAGKYDVFVYGMQKKMFAKIYTLPGEGCGMDWRECGREKQRLFYLMSINSKSRKCPRGTEGERNGGVVKQQLNASRPRWMHKSLEVPNEKYASSYKSFSIDWDGHISVTHLSVEGQFELAALLFVPRRAPSRACRKAENNIDT